MSVPWNRVVPKGITVTADDEGTHNVIVLTQLFFKKFDESFYTLMIVIDRSIA